MVVFALRLSKVKDVNAQFKRFKKDDLGWLFHPQKGSEVKNH